MQTFPGVRRVIVVVLDGLRPDAISTFRLESVRHLAVNGASTMCARTVAPSVTAAAMTSLFTGVEPALHGVVSDDFHIPRPATTLSPLPRVLAEAGYPSSGFMRRLPALFKGIAARISRQLGMGEVRFAGETATEILDNGRNALRRQRRGFVLFHWPDADNAGHDHGWMSEQYGRAAERMDAALGRLAGMLDIHNDPTTLLIALADHGGGGMRPHDHESEHPLDRTIPIVLAGGAVAAGTLDDDVTLLDVPATVLWALGVPRPANYQGRPLTEAFVRERELEPAVA